MRAIWKNQVIAESDTTEVVEGNHYFPPESVDQHLLVPSDHHTRCSWKGEASYYHIKVGGEHKDNGAWYYPDPLPEASHIKDYVAFAPGVEVTAS